MAFAHSLANYLEIYVVFGFFWAWNLTIAIGRTVMAGGVASWYWSKDKKVHSEPHSENSGPHSENSGPHNKK